MDIETAKAAGTMSAAVTSGSMEAGEFKSLAPDFIVQDVAALMVELDEAELL